MAAEMVERSGHLPRRARVGGRCRRRLRPPGPRLVDGVEALAHFADPDTVNAPDGMVVRVRGGVAVSAGDPQPVAAGRAVSPVGGGFRGRDAVTV